MNLSFPSFSQDECRFFTACGTLQAARGRALPKSKKFFVAEIPNGKSKRWMRVIYSKDSKHLHLDIATETYFEKRKPNPSSSDSRAAFRFLDGLEGYKVNVVVRGTFVTQLQSISEASLIRKTMVDASDGGGVSVQMSGARLSFKGLPLESLDWRKENESTILVTVETIKLNNKTIGEGYLVDLYKEVRMCYRMIAFGEMI